MSKVCPLNFDSKRNHRYQMLVYNVKKAFGDNV